MSMIAPFTMPMELLDKAISAAGKIARYIQLLCFRMAFGPLELRNPKGTVQNKSDNYKHPADVTQAQTSTPLAAAQQKLKISSSSHVELLYTGNSGQRF